jgi:hypothetical protein
MALVTTVGFLALYNIPPTSSFELYANARKSFIRKAAFCGFLIGCSLAVMTALSLFVRATGLATLLSAVAMFLPVVLFDKSFAEYDDSFE